MAVYVSKITPPAAQRSPNASSREEGIRILRRELKSQQDPALRALLGHELARLHSDRNDLAAAARDELGATKDASDFVEAIESLIDIATQSHSKSNLTKLLARLAKLAESNDEILRAYLSLAMTHVANDDLESAQNALERALEQSPTEPAFWLALQKLGRTKAEPALLERAAIGRAAHARNPELRALLLERVARFQAKSGDLEAAYSSLLQSFDEFPTLRALFQWEQSALVVDDLPEATRAASKTAEVLRQTTQEPDSDSNRLRAAFGLRFPEQFLIQASLANLRALTYANLQGDRSQFHEFATQLSDNNPHSALTFAIHYHLAKDEEDTEAELEAITQLLLCRPPSFRSGESEAPPSSPREPWSPTDQEVIHSIRALLARKLDRADDELSSLAQLEHLNPLSKLPLLNAWSQAESNNEAESLDRVAKIWKTVDTDFSVDIANLLQNLLQGKNIEARQGLDALVAEQKETHVAKGKDPVPPILWTGLERLIARRSNDSAAYRLATSKLIALVHDAKQKDALRWESLRCCIVEGELASFEEEFLDPWAALLICLRRLVRANNQEDTKKSRDALPGLLKKFVSSAALTEQWQAALTTLVAATCLRWHCWQSISDERHHNELIGAALLTNGAFLLQSRRPQSESDAPSQGASPLNLPFASFEELDERRVALAGCLDDPHLREAWLLISSFSHLEAGRVSLAHQAFRRIAGSDDVTDDSKDELETWFICAESSSADDLDLSFLPRESEHNPDWRLEHAARLYQNSHCIDDLYCFMDQVRQSDHTEAEQLLDILLSAMRSETHLTEALEQSNLLQSRDRASLAMAPLSKGRDSEDALRAATKWRQSAHSTGTLLLQWVSARKDRNASAEWEAVRLLGETRPEIDLSAAVMTQYLASDESIDHEHKLRQRSQLNTGKVALALLEESSQAISESSAADLTALSTALDPTLNDPDAQYAQLAAGFELLALSKFEEALETFEKLLPVLPTDLTLSEGVRFCAHRLNRADLEASACELLAANTEENQSSANLWERAGILYQDKLKDSKNAETCFLSALSRNPDSHLAFERVYALARQRKDRGRQVDLIDARLEMSLDVERKIELYWEKARYCRMLGRRATAIVALNELLEISSDHLPSLALLAELYLVDSKLEPAAATLARVACHAETPATERVRSGLHAVDLWEKTGEPRQAIELLQQLESLGVPPHLGLERRARALARAEDWGEAYLALRELNEGQDYITDRLESARMMLVIQRDHLRGPEDLKNAVRTVLRDAPLDDDAVDLALSLHFPVEERRRLLKGARLKAQEDLIQWPLNPEGIQRYAALCDDCENENLTRIALGNLDLLGNLPESEAKKLESLHNHSWSMPNQQWTDADRDLCLGPGPATPLGKFASIIAPCVAREIEPSLSALGFNESMRVHADSAHSSYGQVEAWCGSFGCEDFKLYVGGSDPDCVRGLSEQTPVILLGENATNPLSAIHRAQLVAQLSALQQGNNSLLNHAPQLLEKWMLAAETLAGATKVEDDEINEMARCLSKQISHDALEKLIETSGELALVGTKATQAPYLVMQMAARAAVFAHGDTSIVRQLPELLPEEPNGRAEAIADLVRFVLKDSFLKLRIKLGLEKS